MSQKDKSSLFICFQTVDMFMVYADYRKRSSKISKLSYLANKKHSQNLLEAIDKLLSSSEQKFNELTSLYIVVSPGSFMSMRLAKNFVMSVLLINKEIKVYLTSAFLLSFYFFQEKNDITKSNWNRVNLSISRTKEIAFNMSIINDGRKKVSWELREIFNDLLKDNKSKNNLLNERYIKENVEDTGKYVSKDKFIVYNFHIEDDTTKNAITNESNLDLIEKLTQFFNNGHSQEVVESIIVGQKIYVKDFLKLFDQKSLFMKLEDINKYPNIDSFMEI